jgi:hypothetical protein
MITHDPRFNTIPGPAQQQHGDQNADYGRGKDYRQGSGITPDWNRPQPIPEQRGQCCNPPEQTGSKSCLEVKASEKQVCDLNFSVHLLMQQCGAAEALPRQFPESSPGFILFCEVTDQNANAHYLVLYLISACEAQAIMNNFT